MFKKVPFGILCFLPSYSLLDKLYKRWEETDLLKLILRHKAIFTESSKGNQNFDKMLNDYYSCINHSDPNDTMNGALLMAVYRGRASEGLDFSDNYARTVIAVGIPFPNIKDLQVDLKRKYNNAYSRMKNILSGDMWYEIQASRAINQALGRCIRHKNDWGAILLIDDRFFSQSDKYSKGLSKWIRQKYKKFKDYKEVMQKLEEFTKKMSNFNKSTSQFKVDSNKYLSYKPVTNKQKRHSSETSRSDEYDGASSSTRIRKNMH
jgi:fanconi anemia group J protein